MYEVLVEKARAGVPISYSDLAKQISAIHLDMGTEKDRAALGRLLGDISRETHEQRIGMLSALAVLKDENEPASAFYKLARELGYRFTDRKIFWAMEYQRVTEHYRRRR